jgi:hypothetical protein
MQRTIIIILLCLTPFAAFSQVYLTKDEALAQHFPGASSIDRKTVFLTDRLVDSIQARAKSKVESKVVTYYVGRKGKEILGYAFLETSVVKTMPETFIVVIDPGGNLTAVEMLAFYEPEDYLPPKRWLAQFEGKTIQSDLWLKRGIQNIVGATLSAQSITEGVRKILALYETAIPKEQ